MWQNILGIHSFPFNTRKTLGRPSENKCYFLKIGIKLFGSAGFKRVGRDTGNKQFILFGLSYVFFLLIYCSQNNKILQIFVNISKHIFMFVFLFVSGFAHIHGYPVGIIGNNGVLYSSCALKVSHSRNTSLDNQGVVGRWGWGKKIDYLFHISGINFF